MFSLSDLEVHARAYGMCGSYAHGKESGWPKQISDTGHCDNKSSTCQLGFVKCMNSQTRRRKFLGQLPKCLADTSDYHC